MIRHEDYFQIVAWQLIEVASILAGETEYKDLLMVKQILALPDLRTRIEFVLEQNKLKHEILEKLQVFNYSSDLRTSVGAIAIAISEVESCLKELLIINQMSVGYTASDLETAADIRMQAAHRLLPLPEHQTQQEVAQPNPKHSAKKITRKKKNI